MVMSNVDHPAHYGGGDNPYEVIKVLRAWDLEGARGFCWGNIIKYTQRADKKGWAVEDRKKAQWYAAELVSIEAELATHVRKAIPNTTVSIPNVGNVVIDWDQRTYDFQHFAVGGVGGAGGSSAPVAGNSGFSPGGVIGGGAGGGAHWPEPVTRVGLPAEYTIGGGGAGGSLPVPKPVRCANLGGCHGGYHARRCPLFEETE
jgi:hypothetical protein